MSRLCLRVGRPDGSKQTINLEGGVAVFAGRVPTFNEEDNAIVDEHEGVSRRHAKFTAEGDGISLVDCGSSNSTFLNGKAL